MSALEDAADIDFSAFKDPKLARGLIEVYEIPYTTKTDGRHGHHRFRVHVRRRDNS